jgi:hypothetical protein
LKWITIDKSPGQTQNAAVWFAPEFLLSKGDPDVSPFHRATNQQHAAEAKADNGFV